MMKRSNPRRTLVSLFALALTLGCTGGERTSDSTKRDKPQTVRGLKNAASFASLSTDVERSRALFAEAGKVLLHARCTNCHPQGERPQQKDEKRPHEPPVVRGPEGHGVPGLECSTCHASENVELITASIPGHAEWHLAPASMAWSGVSLPDICEQLKDRDRNGDKDLEAIIHHAAEDSLVSWAWNPGKGRAPPPGTQAVFAGLIRAWVESGAHCPAPAKGQAAATLRQGKLADL